MNSNACLFAKEIKFDLFQNLLLIQDFLWILLFLSFNIFFIHFFWGTFRKIYFYIFYLNYFVYYFHYFLRFLYLQPWFYFFQFSFGRQFNWFIMRIINQRKKIFIFYFYFYFVFLVLFSFLLLLLTLLLLLILYLFWISNIYFWFHTNSLNFIKRFKH